VKRLFLGVTIGLCLLAGPSSPLAADTAAVAAALPDEASECRYIVRLCEAHRPQLERLKATTAEAERMQETDKQNPPSTTMQQQERLARGRLIQEQLQQEIDESLVRGKELNDAMTVVRAKHTQMPTCFEQCQDVIKLDGFR
jgi:hypothetical protein